VTCYVRIIFIAQDDFSRVRLILVLSLLVSVRYVLGLETYQDRLSIYSYLYLLVRTFKAENTLEGAYAYHGMVFLQPTIP
jgi:hypothetical protein